MQPVHLLNQKTNQETRKIETDNLLAFNFLIKQPLLNDELTLL